METIEETTLLIVVMSQNTTQRQQFTQTQKKGNAWDLIYALTLNAHIMPLDSSYIHRSMNQAEIRHVK